MKKIMLLTGALALSACVAEAQDVKAPEGFQPVSALVALPDFIPGMGSLYVDPNTLPAGPFLAYDKSGKLVSTIYMVPMAALDGQQKFDGLGVGPDNNVVATGLYYNPGHPGVEEPHYHIVLWHVPEDEAQLGE